PNPLPFELPPFTDETLRVLGRIAFEGGLGMLCHYLLLLLVLRSGGHANAQLRQQQTHPEPLRITDETEGPNGTRH
ncbi:MAG TPA: hypothetical protein VFX59_26715, partial [Polyangiales bacterium]|nr:hypothetical protein [Polyangiales bacterium]